MKKENIFDLYAAQHKDEPAQAAERVPGEVKPEDMTPAPEATPKIISQGFMFCPSIKGRAETPQDPEPKQEEGGNEDGV